MSTPTIKLTLGFTKSNRAANYFPHDDGYRADAEQDIVEIDYPDYIETAWDVAERVFIATNAPEDVKLSDAQRELRDLLAGKPIRALSVGDTITYDGVRLECKRVGWDRIDLGDVESLLLGAAMAADADVEAERP